MLAVIGVGAGRGAVTPGVSGWGNGRPQYDDDD